MGRLQERHSISLKSQHMNVAAELTVGTYRAFLVKFISDFSKLAPSLE
jgi:hypothetical protein